MIKSFCDKCGHEKKDLSNHEFILNQMSIDWVSMKTFDLVIEFKTPSAEPNVDLCDDCFDVEVSNQLKKLRAMVKYKENAEENIPF